MRRCAYLEVITYRINKFVRTLFFFARPAVVSTTAKLKRGLKNFGMYSLVDNCMFYAIEVRILQRCISNIRYRDYELPTGKLMP